MKLLFFNFELPYLLKDSSKTIGGAAVQWKSWMKGFLDNGHNFGILTWEGASKYINKNLEVDIVESYDPSKGIKKIRLFYYIIPRLYKSIKNYKPDYVIQASATSQTFILMIVTKFLRIPFIHRIAHDTHVDERIYTTVNKRRIFLFKIGLKYADFVVAQNGYQLEKLKKTYPQKNIFILHNPFEMENKEIDITPKSERDYVAWVGNFRQMKNMEALYKLVQQLPSIKFKIAGNKHKDIDSSTSEAVRKLEKLNNVEFVGYIKRAEIKSFFLSSVALLNTSHFEGFSNTFLEAWSCGTPVISTNNVNPDDIISKYSLGKIAENYDGLVESISYIINLDEKEYGDLSSNCFKYVKEYHNPQKLAEKFISHLTNAKTR